LIIIIIIINNQFLIVRLLNNFKRFSLHQIGDWGLGIGDWGLGPIPNPHSRFNSQLRVFFFF